MPEDAAEYTRMQFFYAGVDVQAQREPAFICHDLSCDCWQSSTLELIKRRLLSCGFRSV